MRQVAVPFDRLLLAPLDIAPGLNSDEERQRFAVPAYRLVGDEFLGWAYRGGILVIDRAADRAAFFPLADYQLHVALGRPAAGEAEGAGDAAGNADSLGIEVEIPRFLCGWLDGLWDRFNGGVASIGGNPAADQPATADGEEETVSGTIRKGCLSGLREGLLKIILGDVPGEFAGAAVGALPEHREAGAPTRDVLIKRHAAREIVRTHAKLTGRLPVWVEPDDWSSGRDFTDERFFT